MIFILLAKDINLYKRQLSPFVIKLSTIFRLLLLFLIVVTKIQYVELLPTTQTKFVF